MLNKAISIVTVYFSLFIIATIPICFASVQPWVWSFYSLTMLIVWIAAVWSLRDGSLFPIGNLKKYPLLFFTWSLLMCCPLPPFFLSLISHVRSATLNRAWELTGSAPSWQSISYSPKESMAWWVFLLSLGLFYLVIRNLLLSPKTLKRFVFVLIMVGIFEALYGLIQALVPSLGVLWINHVPDYMGTARGTFINRNNFAGFIGMIWPIAFGVTLSMAGRMQSIKAALGSERLNRQALMALGVIVLLLALTFSRSRAGIASGVIGFLTFSMLARASIRNLAVQTRVLLGGSILLLCVYILMIGVGPVMTRFLSIANAGSSRLDIWRDSLPIVIDHPLGIGLGNYEKVFAVYNHAIDSDKTVVYAHNDYLQLLIESGVIGFSTLACGFLFFLAHSLRRIRRLDFRHEPLRAHLAVGAFSGLISISTHSFFDFNLQIPANCLYFIVLMAIVNACTRVDRPAQEQTDLSTVERCGLKQAEP